MTLPVFDFAEMHAAGLVAAVVLLIAASTDIRTHKIHNRLTYSAMLIGLMLAMLSSWGASAIAWGPLSFVESLIGIVACGALMLIPYQLSGGGAGDVKLAMAVGSLVGTHATVQGFALGYTFAAGFILLRFVCHPVVNRAMVGEHVGRLSRRPDGGVATLAAMNPSAPVPLAGFFAAGMFAASMLGMM